MLDPMKTHPPVWVVEGERQVIHNPVGVAPLVGAHLHAGRKALQTEVEVRTLGALDAYAGTDVLIAVVAVVERPVVWAIK